MHADKECKATTISVIGRPHPEIYVEWKEREHTVECTTRKPRVGFRETTADLFYTHEKQSRGAGQDAHVNGFVEPMVTDPETERTLSS